MGVYTSLLRPLLFTLPPERAQALAEAILGIRPLWKAAGPLLRVKSGRLECHVGGIPLPNPVGLAAGYDKDCRLLDRLARLGFGYIVAGTVVAEPRAGNPRPRLLRDPGAGSLINSLGFPSQGLERALGRLERSAGRRVTVLASISGVSIEEFLACYEAIQPAAAGVELNISSPNTEGIAAFQEPAKLEELLAALRPMKHKPLFLKLPPYFDGARRNQVLELVDVATAHSVEGVTAVNTWPREDPRLATGRGGVSGRPLFPHMLRIVEDIRKRAGEGLTINACGGISSGEDAVAALVAGANTVQVFTGFVYGGPGLMAGINRHILRFMDREGISSIKDIAGYAAGGRRSG